MPRCGSGHCTGVDSRRVVAGVDTRGPCCGACAPLRLSGMCARPPHARQPHAASMNLLSARGSAARFIGFWGFEFCNREGWLHVVTCGYMWDFIRPCRSLMSALCAVVRATPGPESSTLVARVYRTFGCLAKAATPRPTPSSLSTEATNAFG